MNENELLDWDSEISSDSGEYIVLPEGDYPFTVKDVQRSSFKGSDKIPPCNKVSVNLVIDTEDGKAYCTDNFYLVKKVEWKISAFFRAIGMKRKGEKVKMDWPGTVGNKGMAHFKPEKWKGDNSDRTSNRVDYYIDYDEAKFSGRDKEGFMNVSNGPDEGLPFN